MGIERWVYVGLYEAMDGSRLYGYVKLPDEGAVSDMPPLEIDKQGGVLFYGEPLTRGRAGLVCEVEVSREDGHAKVGEREYLCGWPHKHQLVEWQAKADATAAIFAARSKKNKERRHNAIFEALAPIRVVCNRSSKAAKLQLLALVIEYVTRRKE